MSATRAQSPIMPLHVAPPAYFRRGKHRLPSRPRVEFRPSRYVGHGAAAAPPHSRPESSTLNQLEQFGLHICLESRHKEVRPRRFGSSHFGSSCRNCALWILEFKREMTRHYVLGKLIGAGTFGTVYEATCRRSGREFAVKTIHKRFSGEFLEAKFVRRVHHEVDIYMHMGNSLNVAHLYDVYEDDSCVDLIMEKCRGGDLWTRIRKGDYSEEDGARIIREVLRTVSQFHAQGVVLRDVKPENFLFATSDRDSHLKAIDFGIAKYCGPNDTLTERAGTPVYVAPEVLKMEYGHKADIWSAGVLAYQLLTGRLPFIGDNGLLVSKLYMSKQIFSNKDVFRAILYADLDFTGKPWDEISQDAKDLVQKLLTRDASRRPTAAEALSHPWFQALDVAQATPPLSSTNGNGARAPGVAMESRDRSDWGFAAGQRGPLLDTVVQRLQRFGTYGRLKQAALRGIANVAVSVADDVSMLEEIQSTFKALDEEGDGRVLYSTFIEYLQSGGFELTDTEKDVLISQLDIEQTGYIKYDEWLAAMLEWQQLQQCEQWEQWVEEAFLHFDLDGAGHISKQGLSKMLCSGEQCAMPDTIAAALREADKDRDGGISLDEFLHLVHMSSSDCLSNFEGRRPRS